MIGIIVIIIVILINVYFLTRADDMPLSFAAKPGPTQSLVKNGLKYLQNNPGKKVPDAYKPLVKAGILKQHQGSWVTSKPISSFRPTHASGSGNKPSGTGNRPSGPGNKPSGPGNKPSGTGNKPGSYGNKPSAGGNKPSAGGNKPSGNKPSGTGNKPSAGGNKPSGTGNKPSGQYSYPKNYPISGPLPATSSKFCSNVGYSGAHSCGSKPPGGALYVEDDPVQNDSAKTVWRNASPNAIKAAYLSLGTNVNGSSDGLSKTGCQVYGSCIDYGNPSTAAKALAMARNVVDQAAAKGANAIRLDELDRCQGGSQACQQSLNKVLSQVSKYAAQKGLGVVAADWAPSVQALQTASQNGGAPIIGGMTDGSNSDAGPFASIIGQDKPIFQVNS